MKQATLIVTILVLVATAFPAFAETCDAAKPCPPGSTCINGVCVPNNGTCDASKTCPTGQTCINGVCVPTSNPCPPGTTGINGVCVPNNGTCDASKTCPTGQTCINGVCVPTSNPCPPGQTSVNGTCTPNPGATTLNGLEDKMKNTRIDGQGNPGTCGPNTPCPPGQTCTNGTCVPNPGSITCPPGQTNINGTCTPNPGTCGTNNPCPPGQTCTNGTCTGGNFLSKLGEFFKKVFAPLVDFFKKIFGNSTTNNGDCTGTNCPPVTPPTTTNPPVTTTPPVTPPVTTTPPTTPTAPPTSTTPPKGVQQLTSGNFAAATAKGVTVVEFYTDWCGACKAAAPSYNALANSTSGAGFGKINAEQASALSSRFGVRAYPTFVVLKDGQPVKTFTGYPGEGAIRSAIDSAK